MKLGLGLGSPKQGSDKEINLNFVETTFPRDFTLINYEYDFSFAMQVISRVGLTLLCPKLDDDDDDDEEDDDGEKRLIMPGCIPLSSVKILPWHSSV